MNIMIFTPGYPPWRLGGEEYYSFHQANTLIELRHNVYVIAENRRSRQKGIIKKANGCLNISLVRPPRTRHASFGHFLTMLWYIFAALEMRIQPDLILGHDTIGPGLAAVIFGKLTHTPVIVTWHGAELIKKGAYRRFSKLGNVSRKLVCVFAQGIILNSELLKNLATNVMGETFAPKFCVIPPGVDTSEFCPEVEASFIRREYDVSDSPLVLAVGRLEKVKGFDLLVQAIPHVRKEFPHAKFMIVGDGPQKEFLAKLAASLDVNDCLVFTGPVKRSLLPAFYVASDVFIVPSRAEGFGMVFLEAWASGKPVITTSNVPAIASLIKQRGGGLVSNGDPSDLGQALTTLLSDRDARMKMGRIGREIASDFSWRKMVERTLAFSRKLECFDKWN
jgi:glycosyltransferase involved in cell wall biosynthesis